MINKENWKCTARLRSNVVEMWIDYKIKTLTLKGIIWNESNRQRLAREGKEQQYD